MLLFSWKGRESGEKKVYSFAKLPSVRGISLFKKSKQFIKEVGGYIFPQKYLRQVLPRSEKIFRKAFLDNGIFVSFI